MKNNKQGYRGISKKTGKFLHGSLTDNLWVSNEGEAVSYILDITDIGYYDCWEHVIETIEDYKVKTKSVGRSSTVSDKTGKEIFAGDIIQHDGRLSFGWGANEKALIIDYGYVMVAKGAPFDENSESKQYTLGESFRKHITIIGNIHENPELLENNNEQ